MLSPERPSLLIRADFAYLGDEERLYQLVLNLGTNAIRFTPADALAPCPSNKDTATFLGKSPGSHSVSRFDMRLDELATAHTARSAYAAERRRRRWARDLASGLRAGRPALVSACWRAADTLAARASVAPISPPRS